mmetsp:Transcript_39004/g.107395  ORF Transcript_39004/g.107395 Transcript_39004/m.107395 type:complete len:255 (+) Transcript_39004:303-1067(+)
MCRQPEDTLEAHELRQVVEQKQRHSPWYWQPREEARRGKRRAASHRDGFPQSDHRQKAGHMRREQELVGELVAGSPVFEPPVQECLYMAQNALHRLHEHQQRDADAPNEKIAAVIARRASRPGAAARALTVPCKEPHAVAHAAQQNANCNDADAHGLPRRVALPEEQQAKHGGHDDVARAEQRVDRYTDVEAEDVVHQNRHRDPQGRVSDVSWPRCEQRPRAQTPRLQAPRDRLDEHEHELAHREEVASAGIFL